MRPGNYSDTPEELELLVLRATCQGTAEGSLRSEAARLLANYAWREPVHQAVFGCLASMSDLTSGELNRVLITCLTRKGFPDVDLEIYFQPHGLSKDDALKLTRRLLELR